MRHRWYLGLILLAGCDSWPTMPEDAATPQVASTPFSEPPRPAPTRVNYAPASQETRDRVLIVKYKLVGPQPGGLPVLIPVGAADPEIFHVGLNQIFITEGMVQQCANEGQLAAVVAFEMGRMISERESAIGDEIRQPDRPLPIELKTGSVGSPRDSDPTHYIEMAMFEKNNPKQTKKLNRPNPQLVARSILERAGYQTTDLDAAMPILQNAERTKVLENQFRERQSKAIGSNPIK